MSRAIPLGAVKPVTRSSTLLPSIFALCILSMPRSIQYILLLEMSNAIPDGKSNPVVMRSSILLPSRFDRCILSVVSSIQYILPPEISNAIPTGALKVGLVTRSSTLLPSIFALCILSVPLSDQYILLLADGGATTVIVKVCSMLE